MHVIRFAMTNPAQVTNTTSQWNDIMSESVGERGKMVQRRSWRGNNHLVCKSRYDNNNEPCLLRASRYVTTTDIFWYFQRSIVESLERLNLTVKLNRENGGRKPIPSSYYITHPTVVLVMVRKLNEVSTIGVCDVTWRSRGRSQADKKQREWNCSKFRILFKQSSLSARGRNRLLWKQKRNLSRVRLYNRGVLIFMRQKA